eukprot:scaffold119996_cov23-Prasinocladus_malaysianus.AAC.1
MGTTQGTQVRAKIASCGTRKANNAAVVPPDLHTPTRQPEGVEFPVMIADSALQHNPSIDGDNLNATSCHSRAPQPLGALEKPGMLARYSTGARVPTLGSCLAESTGTTASDHCRATGLVRNASASLPQGSQLPVALP